MTVTAQPYAKFILGLGLSYFNFTAGNDLDHLSVLLAKNTYTPNVDTHEFLSAVTGFEVAGTNYGRVALTGTSWTYDASVPTNKRVVLGANAATFSALTLAGANAARFAIVFRDTGSAATSRLVGYLDFGADQTPTSEDFLVSFSSGVIRARLV